MRTAVLLVCSLAPFAAASTILIQSTGNSVADLPLGYYAPYQQYGLTPTVYATEWSQTGSYQDVAFSGTFFVPGGGMQLNYTVTNAIGPGTRFAQNGVARGSINVAAQFNVIEDVALFTLPSLGPGTYYLVLDSPTENAGWIYGYPRAPTFITDAGVTPLGNFGSYGPSMILSSYTPGSTFNGSVIAPQFAITANATPEPATYAMLGVGLAGLSFVKRVRPASPRQHRSPGRL